MAETKDSQSPGEGGVSSISYMGNLPSPPPRLPHRGGGNYQSSLRIPLPWWEGLGEGEANGHCEANTETLHYQVRISDQRDLGFTGDTGLAETAPIAVESKVGFHILLRDRTHVAEAFDLVVPCLCQCPDRASGRAPLA